MVYQARGMRSPSRMKRVRAVRTGAMTVSSGVGSPAAAAPSCRNAERRRTSPPRQRTAAFGLPAASHSGGNDHQPGEAEDRDRDSAERQEPLPLDRRLGLAPAELAE